MRSLFDAARASLDAASPDDKVALTFEAAAAWSAGDLAIPPHAAAPGPIRMPGRPEAVREWAARVPFLYRASLNKWWFDELNDLLPGTLPGLLGIVFTGHEPGRIEGHLDVRREVLAPNGYLHAATVVGLADTACGLPAVA